MNLLLQKEIYLHSSMVRLERLNLGFNKEAENTFTFQYG